HYVNSVGQPVMSFTQADVAAGDDGPWIAQPGPLVNAHGYAYLSFRPRFYSQDPSLYSVTAPPAADEDIATYHLFGRRIWTMRMADNKQIERRDYHALSTDIWDAENLSDGPHAGAFLNVMTNGRGQITFTQKQGAALDLRAYSYLATGEL